MYSPKRASVLTPQQQKVTGAELYKDASTSISDKPRKSISSTASTAFNDELLLDSLPRDEIVKLASRLNRYLAQDISAEESALRQQHILSVPLSIFSGDLSPLEALSKYLKEDLGMTNHRIGVALSRDERGIWITYRNAKKKMPAAFTQRPDDVMIPLNLFDDRLSILEALVLYLKDQKNVKTSMISRLIKKSPSTISTVYNRACGKRERTTGHKREKKDRKSNRQIAEDAK